jgi:hypothetical protein
MIPQYTLVKLIPNTRELLLIHEPSSILLQHFSFIYLGEIPNMPGHCVLATRHGGQIISGYHCHDFIPLTEDEI